MKIFGHKFSSDYYTNDVGIGFRGRKNHKKPKDTRLKRSLKKQLSKARRQIAKEA